MLAKELIEKHKQQKKETVWLSAKIEVDTKSSLEELSNKFEISLSELIRIILKDFVNQNNGDS